MKFCFSPLVFKTLWRCFSPFWANQLCEVQGLRGSQSSAACGKIGTKGVALDSMVAGTGRRRSDRTQMLGRDGSSWKLTWSVSPIPRVSAMASIWIGFVSFFALSISRRTKFYSLKPLHPHPGNAERCGLFVMVWTVCYVLFLDVSACSDFVIYWVLFLSLVLFLVLVGCLFFFVFVVFVPILAWLLLSL